MSICADCRYKLSIAFQFQQQCKNSDLKLQEHMRNSLLEQNDKCLTIGKKSYDYNIDLY